MAAMGEMLENIAHQWRQPLSVISTASTGILMEKELEYRQDKEHFNSFKNELNSVLSELKTLYTGIDDNESTLELNEKTKIELFNSLKEFANKRRSKQCNEILKEIGKYKLSSNDKELLEELDNLIKNRNYKDVVIKMENIYDK